MRDKQMTDQNNENGNNNDASAVLSRATRLDSLLEALDRQGSTGLGDVAITAQPAFEGSYRTSDNTFSLGNTAIERVSADAVTHDSIDWSQVDVHDSGISIPHERERLQNEVAFLESKLNEIDYYDRNTGAPVYVLRGHARDSFERGLAGKKESFAYAMQELDVLQAQRVRRANLTQATNILAQEREQQLEHQTQQELLRLEAIERAKQIHARNKNRNGSY
jgi:hypothetical protein